VSSDRSQVLIPGGLAMRVAERLEEKSRVYDGRVREAHRFSVFSFQRALARGASPRPVFTGLTKLVSVLYNNQFVKENQSHPPAIRDGRSSPGCGSRSQAGANRIELHTAHRDPQMGVIEGTGIEAVLPDMSGGSVRGVPVGSVAPVSELQSQAEVAGGRGDDDQVDVIGHETIAEQGEPVEVDVSL